MVGKPTAPFRCPCTDAHAPRWHSFWVVLEGLGGWPAVLSGRCFRCRDQWVATHFHSVTGWWVWLCALGAGPFAFSPPDGPGYQELICESGVTAKTSQLREIVFLNNSQKLNTSV